MVPATVIAHRRRVTSDVARSIGPIAGVPAEGSGGPGSPRAARRSRHHTRLPEAGYVRPCSAKRSDSPSRAEWADTPSIASKYASDHHLGRRADSFHPSEKFVWT